MTSSHTMSFPQFQALDRSPPHFITPPPFPLKSILANHILLTKTTFIFHIPSTVSTFSFDPSFFQIQNRIFIRMSKESSNAPAETPLSGYMNPLFEEPEDRVGNDRRAICSRQDPLLRVGTRGREIFDNNNQMTIEIKFKIYTDQEVEVNAPTQSTPKVGAGKKSSKSAKLNLIDSKAINTGYLEMKVCPFGKSLIEFKDLVAGACDKYEAGMKNIILNSPFSPELKWKANIGRSKWVLTEYDQWQDFVVTLEKSTKKKGVVSIENENVQVKAKECNMASATKMLIASTNGGPVESQESEESKKERELATHANKIFSQHAIEKHVGGPGKILTLPWNPAFRYRLTYAAAWIWARGVMANIATPDIPPNTAEFRYEIKKSEWIHPDMGVDHRVEMRLKGRPEVSQGRVNPQPGGSRSLDTSEVLTQSRAKADVKPDLAQIGDKRIATGPSEEMDIKPDLKKIKVDDPLKSSINEPIYVSSEFESDWESQSDTRSDSIEIENPSNCHTFEMERFLQECDIGFEDLTTRTILKEAGIVSWTDLIPCLQLTESTLTSKGISRQIANRLMSEAQARISK
ncbi:uncharacterized protein MELLADRAFT_88048 [Melampsora larici-populina 98AG31]|uniref:Uncharacterized protein n=1 Tax=Melampsora larici-populina (strain 98AG31 / pathotype 3-4-7) TaxID=747676 RepID=F4RQ89_MELLP|nr:uncharacterized protein MELLADRAFT_88048 [Melampsora larici-populina 98AG31]EGG05362.1 hypothetical protein MELLADRAFT_88048 [Melampsora larici-populina 98AG31]